MEADFFFRMGSSHTVCQDYAISGTEEAVGVTYAILSDGCSGGMHRGANPEPGAPFTDFGSRLIAQSARKFVKFGHSDDLSFFSAQETAHRVAAMANSMRQEIGLPFMSLNATLLMATVVKNRVRVIQSGDGVLVWRYRHSGDVVYRSTQFGANMPLYPSYLLNENHLRGYMRDAKTISWEQRLRTVASGWNEPVLQDSPLEVTHRAMNTEDSTDVVDMVLLFSDGVESFVDSAGQRIQLPEILDEILGFKNYTGRFIERRCAKFAKTCAERGWKHTDDFSCAGIYLGDEA